MSIVPTDLDDVIRRYAGRGKAPLENYGLMGRMFGAPQNVPTNVAGFVVCILLATLCFMIFFRLY